MTESFPDKAEVLVEESVVLSKFDGDGTDPDSEVERITITNGEVVGHQVIENGEVVGDVEDSELLGKSGLGLYKNN